MAVCPKNSSNNVFKCVCVWIYVNEMNNNNTRDETEKLGLSCYIKVYITWKAI